MSRKMRTVWLLAVTSALCLMLAAPKREPAIAVRMVQVSRGDVGQIAALTGRLGYQGETIVYASATGQVERLYAQVGQRAAKGEALLRVDAELQEAAVAAWLTAAGEEALPEMLRMSDTVVRAPFDCTVRQVLTAQDAAVAAGTPVLLVSSAQQELRCVVTDAEAAKLHPGMTAVIHADGTALGHAAISTISDRQADAQTGQIYREVHLIPEKHIDLPAGAAIDADVCLAAAQGVPVLPLEALSEEETVWWVHDGICTEISARIVLSDELQAWVTLPEGMTVAIGELKEGQRVTEVQP